MLTLRPLASSDIDVIKSWPQYPEEFAGLDYALRNDGWLDHYGTGSGSDILVAVDDGEIVGFSILTRDDGSCPEFRIALHPAKIGKGYGRELTRLTIARGFSEGARSIRLIVRRNNFRAQKLYGQLGFDVTGECCENVQGKPVEFFRMELSRDEFYKRNGKVTVHVE